MLKRIPLSMLAELPTKQEKLTEAQMKTAVECIGFSLLDKEHAQLLQDVKMSIINTATLVALPIFEHMHTCPFMEQFVYEKAWIAAEDAIKQTFFQYDSRPYVYVIIQLTAEAIAEASRKG